MSGGALLLLFPRHVIKNLIPCFLSYAIGTLLGAAFLGMIPAGLCQAPAPTVLCTVLAGIIMFFILEKIVLWRHCHDPECELHGKPGALILIGDAFHNFVDGVVITAAFLTSIPLGISASLAVIAHEVPQELGDIAILLDSGYTKTRAFCCNLISSLSTLPGALIAYFYLGATREAVPYVLALSAASFIYIALADLVPSTHKRQGIGNAARQIALILLGICTVALFRFLH
ncbi:zinc/iron permease [Pelobacter propionicus DSM 2379]|uniref:Zinc/iron permease n=2 Tax=Pelobacter propionicus TaxID=29543 RepID=A1AQE9_PELPD|nr:zinc/iron permease [Pelobacter propionicus DSM 2379]